MTILSGILIEFSSVVRVAKGIYTRPKPLKSFPAIKTTANAEEIALSWVRKHNYTMVHQGIEEAYRLGLQTQAPVKTVFWCSGPSREFKAGNQQVIIKYVAESKLLWVNKPEGSLYHALLVMSAEYSSVVELKTAIKRLGLSGNEIILVIRKLKLQPLLSFWQSKLSQPESEYF